jgi:excisionase family DNA binding protein
VTPRRPSADDDRLKWWAPTLANPASQELAVRAAPLSPFTYSRCQPGHRRAIASVLRRRGIAVSDGALGGTGADSGYRDRVALRVKEAAKMLGVSSSARYEMIRKRQIGFLRLGDHRSIRIPKTEIERLLSENLVPALRV